MFNFLLISFIILFVVSFYLFISKPKIEKRKCTSNKDCDNGEMCFTDIYTNKWCHKFTRKHL